MLRNYNCGELTKKDLNKNVVLCGWVKKVRKLGVLTFIDLRDFYGITQIIINNNLNDFKNFVSPKIESFCQIFGIVNLRSNVNAKLPTGEIEVNCSKFQIINISKPLPMEVSDSTTASENTRLNYRFLDLRRPILQHNLKIKSQVQSIIHNFFVGKDFLNIETPILTRSTPEGARDYLVPSRLNYKKFYALPQSPQLYKQMLMISGIDKYYQIAKCFRDEDLRSDRQPEFLQLDVEMSCLEPKDIKKIITDLFKIIFQKILNKNLKTPFNNLTYNEALSKYGSDKPDTRFEIYLQNVFSELKDIKVPFIQKSLNKNNPTIKGIFIDQVLDNKKIKLLNLITDQFKQPFFYFKHNNDGSLSTSISKFITPQILKSLQNKFNSNQKKGTYLFVSGNTNRVNFTLGAIRAKVGQICNLVKEDQFNFVWITDWPMFEYDFKTKIYQTLHHPFTKPQKKYLNDLENDILNIKAEAYDIVLNGVELGGGSLRIHDPKIQKQIFKILNLSDEQIKMNFDWFIDALKYGTPPHGGIALGLDRIVMALCKTNSIKDVIAFPKNNNGIDQMSKSPNEIGLKTLDQLKSKLK